MGYYVLLLVFIWFFAVNTQNPVLLGVVWGLVALPVITLLWVRYCAASLRVVRSFPDRAYTGRETVLETTVRNTSLLPILWAEMSDTIPEGLQIEVDPPNAFTLGQRAEARSEARLLCLRRGYYRLGPLTVKIADPLGLAPRTVSASEERPLIVYPRVVPLRRLRLPAPSALLVVPSHTPLVEDPTRLVGVREYTPADSLRRIHWPATARTGELMVKEFEFGLSRSTMLCLDLARPDYEPSKRIYATELAIVVATSLAHHAVRRERLEVGLRVEGHDPLGGETSTLRLAPRAGSQQLMAMLELLARVQSVRDSDFAALLREEGCSLPFGTTVVVVTGAETERLAETLLYLKRSGHRVALIVVSRQAMPRVPSGIALHRVWDDEELAGWAQQRVV